MIRIACPHCQRSIRAADKVRGRSVNCPGCGEPFVVPASPTTAPSNSQPPEVEPPPICNPPAVSVVSPEEPPAPPPVQQPRIPKAQRANVGSVSGSNSGAILARYLAVQRRKTATRIIMGGAVLVAAIVAGGWWYTAHQAGSGTPGIGGSLPNPFNIGASKVNNQIDLTTQWKTELTGFMPSIRLLVTVTNQGPNKIILDRVEDDPRQEAGFAAARETIEQYRKLGRNVDRGVEMTRELSELMGADGEISEREIRQKMGRGAEQSISDLRNTYGLQAVTNRADGSEMPLKRLRWSKPVTRDFLGKTVLTSETLIDDITIRQNGQFQFLLDLTDRCPMYNGKPFFVPDCVRIRLANKTGEQVFPELSVPFPDELKSSVEPLLSDANKL